MYSLIVAKLNGIDPRIGCKRRDMLAFSRPR
jgi:hypothetical protein